MIRAIITDVDGVLVGEKTGYNSPNPHPDIIKKLGELKNKGLQIVLCTAKPHYSVSKIINDANLNGFHITNGGALIINIKTGEIFKEYFIDQKDVFQMLKLSLENNFYTEFYNIDDYFSQSDQESQITEIHNHILQHKPKIVNSLVEEAKLYQIIKIMVIAKNTTEKENFNNLFKPYESKLTLKWNTHPYAKLFQFGIITARGSSKKQAVVDLLHRFNIFPDYVLGIGDSLNDWDFIQICRYGATLDNAGIELKNLVKSKGVEFSYVARSVDYNGFLDIARNFSL